MARVRVVNFVSIDGVVQAPLSPDEDRDGGFAHGGWVADRADEAMTEVMREATTSASAMLLGRRSFEILAAAWSGADETEPAVAAMNRVPKYVVSRAGTSLTWGETHLLRVAAADVAALRRDAEGDLVVFGSGRLVADLAAHDLVDTYQLLQFPVLLGAGKRMFGDGGGLRAFVLGDVTRTPNGIVITTYTRSVSHPS